MIPVHLGFFNTSSTRTHVGFQFSTHATAGGNIAPLSAFEAADLRIYRAADGAAFSATQRSSASGVTMTSPFGSLTGFHDVDIDLTDNTDAGFYASGYRYSVVLAPDTETIDSQTITGVVLAYFEIGVPAVNATHVGGTSQTGADIGSLVAKFTGITVLAQWLGALAGKQTADSTARTEIRATGAGSGTFDETTDSQEAIRDRGDAAWTSGTSVTAGIRKNTASQSVDFYVTLEAGGPATGLSDSDFSIKTVSKDGATPAPVAGTITEIDGTLQPGWYTVALTQAETNADRLTFLMQATDCNPCPFNVLTVR